MQCVFDAALLLFQFCFAACANFDLCNTASEFRQTLLQFLAVIFGISSFDLGTNLSATTLNRLGASSAFDDRGVVCVDRNLLCLTELRNRNLIKFDSKILHDRSSAGEDRKIFKHRLTTIAISRSLDCANIQNATHLINDESAECFACDIFGNDDEWLL